MSSLERRRRRISSPDDTTTTNNNSDRNGKTETAFQHSQVRRSPANRRLNAQQRMFEADGKRKVARRVGVRLARTKRAWGTEGFRSRARTLSGSTNVDQHRHEKVKYPSRNMKNVKKDSNVAEVPSLDLNSGVYTQLLERARERLGQERRPNAEARQITGSSQRKDLLHSVGVYLAYRSTSSLQMTVRDRTSLHASPCEQKCKNHKLEIPKGKTVSTQTSFHRSEEAGWLSKEVTTTKESSPRKPSIASKTIEKGKAFVCDDAKEARMQRNMDIHLQGVVTSVGATQRNEFLNVISAEAREAREEQEEGTKPLSDACSDATKEKNIVSEQNDVIGSIENMVETGLPHTLSSGVVEGNLEEPPAPVFSATLPQVCTPLSPRPSLMNEHERKILPVNTEDETKVSDAIPPTRGAPSSPFLPPSDKIPRDRSPSLNIPSSVNQKDVTAVESTTEEGGEKKEVKEPKEENRAILEEKGRSKDQETEISVEERRGEVTLPPPMGTDVNEKEGETLLPPAPPPETISPFLPPSVSSPM